MNMGMGNGLACGFSVIHSNVESVGVQLVLEFFTNLSHGQPYRLQVILLQIKDARHMLPGNDERVTFADWKRITKCPGACIQQDAVLITNFAEGAVHCLEMSKGCTKQDRLKLAEFPK